MGLIKKSADTGVRVGNTNLNSVDKITRLELQVNLCEDQIQVLTMEVSLLRDFIKKTLGLVTLTPAPAPDVALRSTSSIPETNGSSSHAMDVEMELDTTGMDSGLGTLTADGFETSSALTSPTPTPATGREATPGNSEDHHQSTPTSVDEEPNQNDNEQAGLTTPDGCGDENGSGTLSGPRTRTRSRSSPFVQISQADVDAASSFLSSTSNFLNPTSEAAQTVTVEAEVDGNQSARTTGWNRPRLSCKYCPATFPFKSGLLNHERRHTGEKPFKCQYCEAVFAWTGSKTTHERRHTGEKPYNCQFCEETFSHPAARILHERKHTGERPHKCQFCGKAFPHSTGRKSHERTHTGEKPYTCQFCGKAFPQTASRTIHERTHTGEKPYKCKVCGRAFSHAANRTIHETIHTGEKPYKCKICEKPIRHSGNVVSHERTHSGERPYICEYCEKAFRSQQTLYTHIRTHTNEKPYVCATCNRGFSQWTSLKGHEKTHLEGRTSARAGRLRIRTLRISDEASAC